MIAKASFGSSVGELPFTHTGLVQPSQLAFHDRTSTIEMVPKVRHMAPMGQRYRHHILFSNCTELNTAPDVINRSSHAESAPFWGRFQSSSHMRITKNRLKANAAPMDDPHLGHFLSFMPKRVTVSWARFPTAMKGQIEHQMRPKNGYTSITAGHLRWDEQRMRLEISPQFEYRSRTLP